MGDLYEVVYYVRFRGEDFWHLLKCPLVCYRSISEAREDVKIWKEELGAKFQPVIIGVTNGDYERLWIDSIFGVTAIGGADAGELEIPSLAWED